MRIHLFVLLFGGWAWAQDQVIAHLTRPGQGFLTQVLVENEGPDLKTLHIWPFDADGQAFPQQDFAVEPFQSRLLQASDLGADTIAWLRFSESDLRVSAVYQAIGGQARVVVAAQSPGDQFRLHPASTDADQVWDGLAVVNLNATANTVTVTARRLDHSLIDGFQLSLAPYQKLLSVLSQSLALKGEAGYYEIVASQPIALMGLSGTQDRSLIWAPTPQHLHLYAATTFQVRGKGPFTAKASFNPLTGAYDSTWNTGLAFALVDDGSLGDEVAGDGIWSRRFLLEPQIDHPFYWGPLEKGVWLAEGRDDPFFWAVDAQPVQPEFVPDDPRACSRALHPHQPNWLQNAVVYEVFLRSFQDSNGDGKGDIRGLIQRLDVLNDGDSNSQSDLGIDALWLMPVFPSPSYHGYDVTDYAAINPDYGTLDDFRDLVAACHQRGIRVILDLVINHTSSQHPWFAAAKDPNSPYRDWYVWSPSNPNWQSPWGSTVWHSAGNGFYYGLFWSGMPDLNFHNPAVQAELQNIVSFWLDLEVDGFRIDAARYLFETGPGPGQQYDAPETIAWLKDLEAFCRSQKSDCALVLEVWDQADTIASYVNNQGPMAFNFPLSDALIQSVRTTQNAGLKSILCDLASTYQPAVLDANFLTNHDQTRLASVMDGNTSKLKNAASLLLTLPGVAFLYYGEELGMRNGPGSADEQKRLPFAWDPSPKVGFTSGTPWIALPQNHAAQNLAYQRDDSQSLWRHYQNLIQLRHQHPALRLGHMSPVSNNREPLVWSHFSATADEEVVVAINLYA